MSLSKPVRREEKTVEKLGQKACPKSSKEAAERSCGCLSKKKITSMLERVNLFERTLTGRFMDVVKGTVFTPQKKPTVRPNLSVCTIYDSNRLYNVPHGSCCLTDFYGGPAGGESIIFIFFRNNCTIFSLWD